ncbi:MAG: hypothetical protein DYH05_08955 [Acidobacteria bacterium ACB1]|nr:hypothetical protein [Acidobacteria bacterium ACB1]
MDSFDPVISAHKHSSNHREEILSSNIVLCPKCGIDSVIGSNSGYPINDEFLRRMRSHWF